MWYTIRKNLKMSDFEIKKNSYGLWKMAIFWKFSLFLFDLNIYVGINYRPHQPQFRIAFFTSYNFFFGCLGRWFEKVGQNYCFLTSTTIFRRSKNRRLMFLTRFSLFSSNVVKIKVIAHGTRDILTFWSIHFTWKILALWLVLSQENAIFCKKWLKSGSRPFKKFF